MPYLTFQPKQPSAGAPPENRRIDRPLWFLIVASLALPVAIFAIASWISYNQHIADATDRLERTVGIMQEHAIKVFETFAISERYLEELFSDVDDAEIRDDEAEYSMRLRNFIADLPQLRDLWVIDAKGFPLVSGTIHPMPREMNLSDRDYFRAQKEATSDKTYVGEVVHARAANTDFFAITRKRLGPSGAFNGVYLVSIAPEYFVHYYSELPQSDLTVAGLVRADGASLARFPDSPQNATRLLPDSPFMQAIAEHPLRGTARGPSSFDGAERILAYRKLPGQNVYVYAALDVATIRGEWIGDMSEHLIFGVPATLAMFGLAMLALRHTQRLSRAYAQLHEEGNRRLTAEVALRQAQKMEAVGRLTGGIAHDFNNLLTAIVGNTELALRRYDGGDERLTRSLTSIRQASMRAATLVQRLLTFSRQHPQEVKTVDINRLVLDMSELLHRTIGEAVTIETVPASGLWKTAIDPNQLENAIINLAVNARDAMPKGGRLTIETSNAYLDEAYVGRLAGDVKAGQYVMVAISDTGEGMLAEVREKAFEPFFTTKPMGAGSGLGLSMVYGFVKQSGGHVQIYSEPGQGTSIKMYFPRLADETSFPAWDAPQPPAAPESSQHNECILLVEDDEDVNRFATEALIELGYRVKQARTAAEALVLLQNAPEIALLFTDVVLPGGMNGRELANEAHKTRPDLPVLFATGYTRNAIIHHGRLDANVELLTKPFTTEALARKIRQVLDSRTAPDRRAT
jgi:two-component system NtrC family sensor kinase